jgi:hypothetical protein
VKTPFEDPLDQYTPQRGVIDAKSIELGAPLIRRVVELKSSSGGAWKPNTSDRVKNLRKQYAAALKVRLRELDSSGMSDRNSVHIGSPTLNTSNMSANPKDGGLSSPNLSRSLPSSS